MLIFKGSLVTVLNGSHALADLVVSSFWLRRRLRESRAAPHLLERDSEPSVQRKRPLGPGPMWAGRSWDDVAELSGSRELSTGGTLVGRPCGGGRKSPSASGCTGRRFRSKLRVATLRVATRHHQNDEGRNLLRERLGDLRANSRRLCVGFVHALNHYLQYPHDPQRNPTRTGEPERV